MQKIFGIHLVVTLMLLIGVFGAFGLMPEVHTYGTQAETFLRSDSDRWAALTMTPHASVSGGNATSAPNLAQTKVASYQLFTRVSSYYVPSFPDAVAIGDVNSDGRGDVVMTTKEYDGPETDYHLFVFLQNASGNLRPPVTYPAGNGTSVDIGDLNHDGKQDVVVTADNAIGVFLQKPDGSLAQMVTYPSSVSDYRNTFKLRVADLNHDGWDDVVAIGWATGVVEVLIQNSKGTLNPPVMYSATLGGYDDLKIGDVNNDGRQDILVMSGQGLGNNIGVLLQKSDGTFADVVYYQLGGKRPLTTSIAVGDVNVDKLQDVVAGVFDIQNYNIAAFLQHNGKLKAPVTYHTYASAEATQIQDLDLDGRNDVTTLEAGGNIGIFLQNSQGTLVPSNYLGIGYASHFDTHALAIGDFDGDNCPDVAIANYNSGLVMLMHMPQRPALVAPKKNQTITDPEVILKWHRAKCTDTYSVRILKGSANGPGIEGADHLKVPTFQTKGLQKGQIYFWQVSACSRHGCTKSAMREFSIQ